MVLIDALYLNSFGGKILLELFLEKFISGKAKYHFLLDSRLKSKWVKTLKSDNYSIIITSHKNRKCFYEDNIFRFSSILCLSNIPPPIRTNIRTSIYFHNRLLIKPLSHKINLKSKLFNLLKSFYIKRFNQKNYKWIVQTPLMKKLLQDDLKIDSDNCHVYPFYKIGSNKSSLDKTSNNFIYSSSSISHKNHKRLIEAFVFVANRVNLEITLHLTIDNNGQLSLVLPNNLKIIFHGTLSIDRVNKLYNTSEFAIYPSLVESFGLPLIEAANHGCKVIASDLPYVHEIIEPSLTFDPYSVDSISTSILKAINEDLSESKVLVENKLDKFIDFIISQDVQ